MSSDERLDQEFNSIDAQKEAGHAYIASQRAEGWIPVTDDYDDPGSPAATRIGLGIETPAGRHRARPDRHRGGLQDRPPDAQPADFSKMVELCSSERGVSFVSVTQQFNTTTPMGRLMLNVLLSFAQFEREVTGERIRDKIAAAKRKGMWMGGVPSIGYDVDNRLVGHQRGRGGGGAAHLRGDADHRLADPDRRQPDAEASPPRRGRRRRPDPRSGTRIDKKYLHKLLRKPHLPGELSHKGNWYPGASADHRSGRFGKRFTRCWPRTVTCPVGGNWKIRSRTDARCGLPTRPRASDADPTGCKNGGTTTMRPPESRWLAYQGI